MYEFNVKNVYWKEKQRNLLKRGHFLSVHATHEHSDMPAKTHRTSIERVELKVLFQYGFPKDIFTMFQWQEPTGAVTQCKSTRL